VTDDPREVIDIVRRAGRRGERGRTRLD
jgi:hypothetical protein